MKTQLYYYIGIIIMYVMYNQFFQVKDEKTNAIINILFASFLFGYIAYRLTKENASLSCLQLFLSFLYQNIEGKKIVTKKPFEMKFDGMACDYRFGLYDL